MKELIATVGCVLALVSACAGQRPVSAEVRISAVVRGSITLSVRTIPVVLRLGNELDMNNHFAFPLEVRWNLNPIEVQGFEVVAYFHDSRAALVDSRTGTVIPSTQVLGRTGSGTYRRFAETNFAGPANGSWTALRTHIHSGSARGKWSDLLEIRVDEPLAKAVPAGEYQGVLYLEARHY